MTLLALDVGNTSVTVGVFRGARLIRRGRIATRPNSSVGALARGVKGCARGLKPDAAIYASVVPALDLKVDKGINKAFGVKARRLDWRSRIGVRLKIKRPREVGADRIANALAAWRLYGGPAVVMDFGTATTFDCVSSKGEYLGGAILPGPRLAAAALARGTAKLPLVSIRRPRRAIGRDTVECLRAGLYFGYLGMIEKVLNLTLREMGGQATLIATGGYAGLYARDLPRRARLAPDLTLQGLRLAYEELAPGRDRRGGRA